MFFIWWHFTAARLKQTTNQRASKHINNKIILISLCNFLFLQSNEVVWRFCLLHPFSVCAVMTAARTVAMWIGGGKHNTAGLGDQFVNQLSTHPYWAMRVYNMYMCLRETTTETDRRERNFGHMRTVSPLLPTDLLTVPKRYPKSFSRCAFVSTFFYWIQWLK